MNILIVPSWYISDSNRILGSFFREQAVALRKAGHNVSLAYVYMRGSQELLTSKLFRIQKYDDEGVKTYCYNIPSLGSMKRGTWFQKNTRAYRKLLRYVLAKEPVELIHAHSFVPAGFAMVSLKEEFHLPVVYTEHFSGVHRDSLSPEKKDALKKTVNGADRVLAVSQALKHAMLAQVPERSDVEVVPNIISPLFYTEDEKKPKETFHIISIGSLTPGKRHDLTIRAFHAAFDKDIRVRLDIIGGGPSLLSLQSLVSELGEESRIFLSGRKSREDTANQLRHSDLFVLPSDSETFGVVYAEALASGVPVIGSRNGGFEDIYEDNCGYMIDVGDMDALTAAMKDAYVNIHRFDPASLSEMARKKYSEKTVIEMLERIYAGVMKG